MTCLISRLISLSLVVGNASGCGTKSIADALMVNKTLTSLKLSSETSISWRMFESHVMCAILLCDVENDIGPDECKAIADALADNRTLLYLDLSSETSDIVVDALESSSALMM